MNVKVKLRNLDRLLNLSIWNEFKYCLKTGVLQEDCWCLYGDCTVPCKSNMARLLMPVVTQVYCSANQIPRVVSHLLWLHSSCDCAKELNTYLGLAGNKWFQKWAVELADLVLGICLASSQSLYTVQSILDLVTNFVSVKSVTKSRHVTKSMHWKTVHHMR